MSQVAHAAGRAVQSVFCGTHWLSHEFTRLNTMQEVETLSELVYPSQASSYIALHKSLPDAKNAIEGHTAMKESGLPRRRRYTGPNSPQNQSYLKGPMNLGV